ncbi:MAG: AAA family ATPase [Acetatifactor sp.]|nr:AAA family ATPase [Acetatifactor sp.]MDE7044791.1 AAA family ATPase [Acetatifactor sp.]
MDQIFITNLTIQKVRHLKDITIPLSKDHIKHLILTGKNGSGKTSVVEAVASHLDNVFTDEDFMEKEASLYSAKSERDKAVGEGKDEEEILRLEKDVRTREENLWYSREGLDIQFNHKTDSIYALKEQNHYVLAYYSADREFYAMQPQHVEKVQLREDYGAFESPRNDFVKYLLDLKMTEALSRNNKKTEKADEIQAWFAGLEELLKKIFDDDSLKLIFDEETFRFHILQEGREFFDFNTLSDGYQAVLDIVLDIIMRMVKQTQRAFDFRLPGIVVIDEIETHLHLELQKNIMPLLTAIFPNIQFVVTSHSPFVLSSLENAVIYDLENRVLVESGLVNVPYDGIVEGYFGVYKLSDTLKEKYERYKSLVGRKYLTDDELAEIAELEMYLDEIPDYLALNITTEYRRLKLEFMNREDIDG